jgi:formylmethanofuran dehydrogenase subunit C
MNTVTLTVKKAPELYLECENVNPDVFAGKKADQIAKLGAYQGKEIATLGDYFTIAGEAGATAADTKIVVNGDCTKMKYLGAKMTAGEMVVNSACDMYTGSWMKGGKLVVNGDVHSFCGLAMAGGEMIIEGDVDIHLGTHMEGGKIVLKGNANRRVGGQLVKGEIYVFGTINVMMPGYKPVGEAELTVDGTKAKFVEYIGDLGERHPKRKGETVYGKLYMKK